MAIASVERRADTLDVRPSGRLDTARTPLLDEELRPHLDGVRFIAMDFSDVEYVSSSCLRLLLRLEQEMEDRGGEVRIAHASGLVLNILDLAGFREVVRVVED